MGIRVPEEQIVLRYTNAIDTKYKKYRQYRNKHVIANSEPYIIAVNGKKVPYASDDEIPYIVQALFPIGQPRILVNWDTPEETDFGYAHRPEINKVKGGIVSTDIFCRREYEGISGIIFSRVSIHGFSSDMGADFIFVHNPLALNKLPEGWLGVGREYRCVLECRRWSK